MASDGSSMRERILRRRALLLASTLSGMSGAVVSQHALADTPPDAPPQGSSPQGAMPQSGTPQSGTPQSGTAQGKPQNAGASPDTSALASLPYPPGSFALQQHRFALWPCKASPPTTPADQPASLTQASSPSDQPNATEAQALDELFDLLRRARAGDRDSALRVQIGELAERSGYRALAYLAYEAAVRCGHQPQAPLLDKLALLSAHVAVLISSGHHRGAVVVFPSGVRDKREVFYLVNSRRNLVDAGTINLRLDGTLQGMHLTPGQEHQLPSFGRPQVCLSPPPPPPPPNNLRFGIAGGPFAYASATSDPLVNGYFEVAAMLHIPAGKLLAIRPMVSVAPGLNAFGFSVLADGGAQLQFHASDTLSLAPSFRAGYRYLQDGAPTDPQNHVSIAAPYLRPELALMFRFSPIEAGARLGGLIAPERAPVGSERWGGGPIVGLWISYLFGEDNDELIAYHPALPIPSWQ